MTKEKFELKKSIVLCINRGGDWRIIKKLPPALYRADVIVAQDFIGAPREDRISLDISLFDYVGVLLSRKSINSRWINEDLQFAKQGDFPSDKGVFIPMLIEPLEKGEIPAFLRDLAIIDFTNPREFRAAFSHLLATMGVFIDEDKWDQIFKFE